VLITLTLIYLLNVCQHADSAHAWRLSHLQRCPTAVLRLCYFGYVRKYTRLSSFSPIYAAGKTIGSIPAWIILAAYTTRLGLVVTQAFMKYYLSNTNDYYGSAPGSYASMQLKLYILIAAFSLFGGKSSLNACQIHGVPTQLKYVSKFYPPLVPRDYLEVWQAITYSTCYSYRFITSSSQYVRIYLYYYFLSACYLLPPYDPRFDSCQAPLAGGSNGLPYPVTPAVYPVPVFG